MIGMTITVFVHRGDYIDGSLAGKHEVTPYEDHETTPPSLSELPSLITNILPQHPLGSMVGKEML